MHRIGDHSLIICLVAFLAAFCSGCADYEWAVINPWIQRQWAEDEQFGPTVHQQLADLDRIRRAAPSMTAQDRAMHANRLGELYRDEPSPLLRASIARTVGELKTPQCEPTLRAALTDADVHVRTAACEGWKAYGGPVAVDALAEVVGGDTDLDVRMAATRALGQFDGKQTEQALALALNDADPALQRRAIESLRTVSGEEFGDDVIAWRQYVQGGRPETVQPSWAERFGKFLR